jgi:hypothetical protein
LTRESTLRRTLGVLAGAAALIAALLGALQIDSSRKSSRAAAESSRLAVEIFEELTSAGLDLSLDAFVIREQFEIEINADAINVLTGDGAQSGLGAVARADKRSASRLKRAWATMIGKPLGLESGPALLAEQMALKERGDAMVARQNASFAEAEKFGRRSGGASRGLLLVATAAALFALAGSIHDRWPAWLALGTGVLVLLAAVVTGVLALLV